MRQHLDKTDAEGTVTPIGRFFFCSPFAITPLVARIKGSVTEEASAHEIGVLKKETCTAEAARQVGP